MATFKYEAMDASGGTVRDTVDAESSEAAIAKIRGLGYFPTKVRQAEPPNMFGLTDQTEEKMWLPPGKTWGGTSHRFHRRTNYHLPLTIPRPSRRI